MSNSRPLTTIFGAVAAVIGVGYGVATYGASKSVGLKIPEEKAILRTQGAQGESRKAGLEEEAKKIEKVETHGGDKGFKVLDKDG